MKYLSQKIISIYLDITQDGFFDYWKNIIENNILFAIIIGIILSTLEAFFPVLPLIAIVAFNFANLGVFQGGIVTIIGSTLGIYLVFLVINKSIGVKLRNSIEKRPKVLAASKWLENRSSIFIILVMGNPYMPTSIFNYAFSLTNINKRKYAYIVLASRICMVTVIGLLGAMFDIENDPLAILWIVLTYIAVYILIFIVNKFVKHKKRRVIMSKKTIRDVELKGKTVLMRVDFNVPMKDGEITDENRIVQALPTIKYVLEQDAKLVLFSHLGRVKEEADKAKNSLAPVAKRLSELLGKEVKFIAKTRGLELEEAVKNMNAKDIVMFENTRFEDVDGKKESKNNPELGKYWASLGDVFVNDAFGTAHRAHASNAGIAENIDTVVAGFLMEKEIRFIGEAVDNPKRPFVAILGGAKVSDKISVIENLLEKADKILICGAMAYTFYKALGFEVGTSKCELDYVDYAKTLLEKANGKIILPNDAVVAKEFAPDADTLVVDANKIPADMMGLDVGEKTIELFKKELQGAKTVVWNGPAGVFEFDKFAYGTNEICKLLANLENATTIIGGGDSAAAAIKLGYEDKFTHISTGGGASLEYLEGKELPGIAIIDDKCGCCNC